MFNKLEKKHLIAATGINVHGHPTRLGHAGDTQQQPGSCQRVTCAGWFLLIFWGFALKYVVQLVKMYD